MRLALYFPVGSGGAPLHRKGARDCASNYRRFRVSQRLDSFHAQCAYLMRSNSINDALQTLFYGAKISVTMIERGHVDTRPKYAVVKAVIKQDRP